MPRRSRLDEPGALHHVTARGVARSALFLDDYDRRSFVRSMERVFREGGVRCLAWALMTNHFHLLVETGAMPLAGVMQRLLTRHAVRFNKRHDRTGHLFQNRYGSERVESERHLLAGVRYVHLNPVAAGLVPGVEALESYAWTGHAALMGRRENAFQDVVGVLSLLDADPRRARSTMRGFVSAGVDEIRVRAAPIDPAMPVSRRAAFEASSFGVRALRARWDYLEAVRRRLDSRDARRAALRRDGWTIDRLVNVVASRTGAVPRDVVEGRKRPLAVRARGVVAFLACEHLGLKQSCAARRLGVGQSAMPACIERGRVATRDVFGDPARVFGA